MAQNELDRLRAVQEESEAIGRFLAWCTGEQGYSLVQHVKPSMDNEWQRTLPIYLSINQLLAQYFNIDLDKVEQEKREILAAWNASQGR